MSEELDEIVVAEDENGVLVVGSDAAIDQFLESWKAEGVVAVRTSTVARADAAAALSAVADLGVADATAVRYVHAQRESAQGIRTVVREWKQGADGKIISKMAVDPRRLAAGNPTTALAMIAVRAALEDATARILDSVERVGDLTEEVLRLAGADRAGDVHAHHRVLRRRVAAVDAGIPLGETDWSMLAALGTDLEVGVERLREYAIRLVADLPVGARADDRAVRLDRVVRAGRLGEVLQLLVVAEQSLYLWQRVRVEQVRLREPDLLGHAVADAHGVLAEHARADGQLATELRSRLREYGELRALEFHRRFSGQRLREQLAALRQDLDRFSAARGLQIEGWEPLVAPTARDALRAARAAATTSGRSLLEIGGRVVDGGLAGISRAGGAVQSTADRWRGEGAVDTAPVPDEQPGTSGSTAAIGSTADVGYRVDVVEPGREIEARSAVRLPFEPAGPMRDFRTELTTACRTLVAVPGEVLHAVYSSDDGSPVDVENVLTYNLGTGAVSAGARHGVVLERSFARVGDAPQDAHHHRYRLVDTGHRWTHWEPGAPLASLRFVADAAIFGAGSCGRWWTAARRAGCVAHVRADTAPERFVLRIQVSPPSAWRGGLIGLLKPLTDGVVAAMQAYDGVVDEALLARAATVDPTLTVEEFRDLLTRPAGAPLGRGRMVVPRGAGVMWLPADDQIVALELHLAHAEPAGTVVVEAATAITTGR